MTPKPYTGLVPSNVSKDAKYSVSVNGEIRLLYRINNRERELLATRNHKKLADMVNEAKRLANGREGGAFYINEFGDVLVPGLDGECYWAGHYEGILEFAFGGGTIGPGAPTGLQFGDPWEGPHVGIRYVLAAGGQDVKYVLKEGNRQITVPLSDEVGAPSARETAARIARVKGTSGGRFYINEQREMFGPVSTNDYEHFVYIGPLEDSAWFSPPDGYDRP